MSQYIANKIKEIRKSHSLTQKQFAKKFFITEKTISNYENNRRSPDINFLNNLSRQFNLSLDYFAEKDRKGSEFNDLRVSERGGKFAIYDSRQGINLTEHIYDMIYLSPIGLHIVVQNEQYNENGKKIKNGYSAILNNLGEIRKFPDYKFVYKSGFESGVCPIRNKKDNKMYLIDESGKIKSQGYDVISFVNMNNNYGLFYTFNYLDKEKHIFSEKKLLFKTGETLKYKLTEFEIRTDERIYYSDDIDNIDSAIESLKYGANIIEVFSPKIFKDKDNFVKILNYFDKKDKDEELIKENYYGKEFQYVISLLNKFLNYYTPARNDITIDEILSLITLKWCKNKIEKRLIEIELDKLVNKINNTKK